MVTTFPYLMECSFSIIDSRFRRGDTVSVRGIPGLSAAGFFCFLGFGGINCFTGGFHPIAPLLLGKWYSLFWSDPN